MGGRPRKPRNQKLVQGTFRKDRNPEHEPVITLVDEIRKPPAYLGKYGKRLWQEIATELINSGLLTEVDWPLFEMCCQTYQQYRESIDDIYNGEDELGRKKKRGLKEYFKEKGSFSSATEFRALRNAKEEFLRYAGQLGLTPVARNKIDLSDHERAGKSETEKMWDEVNGS